jgi:hypothetical protein
MTSVFLVLRGRTALLYTTKIIQVVSDRCDRREAEEQPNLDDSRVTYLSGSGSFWLKNPRAIARSH